MFQKLKKYYQVFGFKQTIYKLFRSFNDYSHLDLKGIYHIRKRELKKIKLKEKEVYVFSDNEYKEKDVVAVICEIFNCLGYAVKYICTKKTKEKKSKTPLSLYTDYDSVKYDLKLEKNIIIVDSQDKNLLKHIKSIKKINFITFIDNKQKKLVKKNSYDFCTSLINGCKKDTICDKKFYNNISVIVLNYNNKKVIFECLDTLIKYNKRYNYEIIVVDNQSTDGSFEELQKKYKNIKLLQNSKNGCSSGRNLGIKTASKDYIIFLDSDQWINNENWLDNYIEIYNKNNNVGAIGWAAGWFNSKGLSFHTVDNFYYRYMPPEGYYRSDIGYLGTGGMMVSTNLLKKIKGFDINYDPTCYEDTDLSLKIRNENKELYYCPYLGVEHLPHQTTKSGSENHKKLIEEKGNYFLKKWKKTNPKLLKYKK